MQHNLCPPNKKRLRKGAKRTKKSSTEIGIEDVEIFKKIVLIKEFT